MTPVEYDELRKRLLLEQESAPIARSVGPDASMITPESRRAEQEKQDLNRSVSGLAGAIVPSLMGFTRGTAAEQSSRFDQSNKYLQNIANLEAQRRKGLKEIKNEDGNPEFIAEVNAVGMEPYYQAKGAGSASGGAAKSFTPYDIYRPRTKERFNVVWNSREGRYQGLDGGDAGLEPTDIIKPVANKLIKNTTASGGTENITYNQYDKTPIETINTEAGIGDVYNVPTEGQGKAIEKGLLEGQKEFQQYTGSIKDLESAQKTIKSGNSVRALSAAIYSLVRATEPMGVLTAQDFNTISGNDMMPALEQIEGYAAKKFGGDLSAIRASYAALAEDIKKRLQDRLESIPSRFAPNTKAGKKGLESVIPTKEIERISKEKKAKLIEIETQAKKFFGSNKKAYEGFINKKKAELGL